MSFHHLPRQILFHGREWPSVVINDIIQIQKKTLLENPFRNEMSEKRCQITWTKKNQHTVIFEPRLCVWAREIFSIS